MTACLLAEYALRPFEPTIPPIEEQFTIAPLPWATTCRSSAFMQFQTPRRFTLMMRSNSSSLVSNNDAPSLLTLALLKAASRRPYVATARSIVLVTCALSVTSHWSPNAL
jgi:hypothetical protein